MACSASCEFNTTNCTTSAEATASPSFIAATGGSYTLTNSNNTAKITLPENFYTQDLQVQMFSYDKSVFESSKPAPSGKSFIGKTYDFVFVNPDGGTVSTLSQAATLVLTYTDSNVSGIDQSTLAPYRMGSSDSSWQLISGATVDTANHKVTFQTAAFSSFALFGSPQSSAPSCGDHSCNGSESCSTCSTDCGACPSSGGGGGGGGGGYFVPETKVVFSGRAYPKSTVTILKDAQIAATTIASTDANFQVSVSGLSTGNYIFGIYSEDNKGNRSSLLTFPASVTSGASTNIGGIFIAPTIAVDKSEIKRGEDIAVFGQSVPRADMTIAISSDEEFFGRTIADANGAYLYNFDTSVIDYGTHYAKSKASISNLEISSFSAAIGFKVGTKTVFAKPTVIPAKGDLNNDKRVNLIDFSIAAYWYKKSSPPPAIDLNSDNKVDLVDFSIMAYYWTG